MFISFENEKERGKEEGREDFRRNNSLLVAPALLTLSHIVMAAIF